MNIIVICVFGIESAVSRELRDMGFTDLKVGNGRISFEGDFKDVVICNVWLRTAERIYIETAGFRATDFNTLYDGVFSIDWKSLMPSTAAIPVRAIRKRCKLSMV